MAAASGRTVAQTGRAAGDAGVAVAADIARRAARSTSRRAADRWSACQRLTAPPSSAVARATIARSRAAEASTRTRRPSRVDGTGAPVDPERDLADLADALALAVADPAEARRRGEAGRVRAVEHFSWEAIAERTAEVYRAALAR